MGASSFSAYLVLLGIAGCVAVVLVRFVRSTSGAIRFSLASRNAVPAARTWRRWCAAAATSTTVIYLYGVSHLFTWDKAETCLVSRGTEYDPAYLNSERLWPLSNRCNAEYDFVPAWVNPTVVVLSAVTAVSLVLALLTAAGQRGPRMRSRGSGPSSPATARDAPRVGD